MQKYQFLALTYAKNYISDNFKLYNESLIRGNKRKETEYVTADAFVCCNHNTTPKEMCIRDRYELLFMKLPKKYNKDDMRKYKSILLATNGHKQKYKHNTRINSNSGVKYRLVISKLFASSARKRTGSGYMEMKPNTTIDYVHWDDPNELVNRLRLLMASQNSGHTGHRNEIMSILEELREAGIII